MFLKHQKWYVLMISPSLCFAQTVVDQFESNIMITVKSALQRLTDNFSPFTGQIIHEMQDVDISNVWCQ